MNEEDKHWSYIYHKLLPIDILLDIISNPWWDNFYVICFKVVKKIIFFVIINIDFKTVLNVVFEKYSA